MDNAALEEINRGILNRVQHEVAHALESPTNINRAVGEAMRHIGSLLEMSSATYLPIRQEEVLAVPERSRPDSTDAVLLVTRTVTSDNAFMVLSNCKTNGTERAFDLVAYQPDNFDLNKTKFVKLPPEVGNEIIRQLNSLISSDGLVLLQVVIAKNYFKIEEQPAAETTPIPEEKPVVTEPPPRLTTPGALPPVTEETLL